MFYRVTCEGQLGFKLYMTDGGEKETGEGIFFDAKGKEVKGKRFRNSTFEPTLTRKNMKIKNLLVMSLIIAAAASAGFAQRKKAADVTPDQVVRNLYTAQKSDSTNPFVQRKSRSLIDKYFAKDLADLIWKTANAETGWNFDPLTYAQDSQITRFTVGKIDKNGDVFVNFKSFGADNEIRFHLMKDEAAPNAWKIDSIMYADAEDLGEILANADMTEAEKKEAAAANKLDGDYMFGTVKCNISTNMAGYWARVKCDDQENIQIIDTETLTFGTFRSNEKGRRGKLVLQADGSVGEYVNAAGKKTKVTRVK